MHTRRRFLTAGVALAAGLVIRPAVALPQVWRPTGHALNHPVRCQGWWLVSPLAGHASWRDLIHRRPGVVTGATVGTGVVRTTSRAGGWGQLTCAGAQVLTIPGLLGAPPVVTLTCWVWLASGAVTTQPAISMGNYVGIHLWHFDEAPQPVGYAWDGVDWQLVYVTGGELTEERWHHIAFVAALALGRLEFYIDGRLVSSATPAATPLVWTGQGTDTTVGSNGGSFLTGALDDVRFYAAALSAPEIAWLAADARQGYPRLLADAPRLVKAPAADTTTRGRGLLFQ